MEFNDILTVNDISAKFNSKLELYHELIGKGNIFPPPKQDSTQIFLRDIIFGNKLCLQLSAFIITKVHQYKGLQVRDLI